MRDISARELKGHNILAVERFQDSTRWMAEILCAAKVQRGQAGETVLEGTEVQILADVVAQLYACLTECRFVGPLGLAAYAELSSMAASLMLGEWFD